MSSAEYSCKLFVPCLLEEKWGDMVFGFPRYTFSVMRGSEFVVGTLWAQLLLQFWTDPFETLQVF